MNSQASIIIGSRGSPLALAQAEETQARLLQQHGQLTADDITVRIIKTTGDAIQDKALREFGGKGLFTKEIEELLLAGEITMAVHSMKDMPTKLPVGLEIPCLLPREDPRDAFVSKIYNSFTDLPQGARLGTSSLRRGAQALHRRPDLEIVPFRGNVQTRLRKLDEGQADATFLACAGLNRLKGGEHASANSYEPIPMDIILPAPAQGAIGIEIRSDDDHTRELLAPLNHSATQQTIEVERAFLAALDGSCHTPIAAHAIIENDQLEFKGEIFTPDGSRCLSEAFQSKLSQAAETAATVGASLRSRAGDGFFETA